MKWTPYKPASTDAAEGTLDVISSHTIVIYITHVIISLPQHFTLPQKEGLERRAENKCIAFYS